MAKKRGTHTARRAHAGAARVAEELSGSVVAPLPSSSHECHSLSLSLFLSLSHSLFARAPTLGRLCARAHTAGERERESCTENRDKLGEFARARACAPPRSGGGRRVPQVERRWRVREREREEKSAVELDARLRT